MNLTFLSDEFQVVRKINLFLSPKNLNKYKNIFKMEIKTQTEQNQSKFIKLTARFNKVFLTLQAYMSLKYAKAWDLNHEHYILLCL